MALTPLKVKKICSDYGVQIDQLGLTVSKQKSVLTSMHRYIGQNVSNFAGLVWKADFGHLFGNIFGLCAHFSNPIFALKSWLQAGRFEYHEPHNPNNFFSLIRGSEPFCQIWLFESRLLFSIYIYKFSDYRQYQFQFFSFFTAPWYRASSVS